MALCIWFFGVARFFADMVFQAKFEFYSLSFNSLPLPLTEFLEYLLFCTFLFPVRDNSLQLLCKNSLSISALLLREVFITVIERFSKTCYVSILVI